MNAPPADATAVIAKLRTMLSDALLDVAVLGAHVDGFQARAAKLDEALTPLRAALAKPTPPETIVALARELVGVPEPTPTKPTRKAR